MMEQRLDVLGATIAGNVLAGTALDIQARHKLSDGDVIALITVCFTQLLELKIGAAATVDYLRNHADELENGLLDGLKPLPIGPVGKGAK